MSLQAKSGTRIYVLAKPYILELDYRITVGLYEQTTQQGTIGEVTSSDWVGMKQHVVGQAQAWLYTEEHTLALWECFLDDRFRQEDLRTDQTLQTLWRRAEGSLLRRLPNVKRIVTPSWKLLYEEDTWRLVTRQP